MFVVSKMCGREDIYFAKMWDRKSRDLCNIRCLKSELQRVLVKDEEIKERCRYFHKLFNENHRGEANIEIDYSIYSRNYRYCFKIRLGEVKGALKNGD